MDSHVCNLSLCFGILWYLKVEGRIFSQRKKKINRYKFGGLHMFLVYIWFGYNFFPTLFFSFSLRKYEKKYLFFLSLLGNSVSIHGQVGQWPLSGIRTMCSAKTMVKNNREPHGGWDATYLSLPSSKEGSILHVKIDDPKASSDLLDILYSIQSYIIVHLSFVFVHWIAHQMLLIM